MCPTFSVSRVLCERSGRSSDQKDFQQRSELTSMKQHTLLQPECQPFRHTINTLHQDNKSWHQTRALTTSHTWSTNCYLINIRNNPIKGRGTLHFTEHYIKKINIVNFEWCFFKHIIFSDKSIRYTAPVIHHTRFQYFKLQSCRVRLKLRCEDESREHSNDRKWKYFEVCWSICQKVSKIPHTFGLKWSVWYTYI